jgi:hypothetical protein
MCEDKYVQDTMLRWLLAGHSPRRPGFKPMSVHVGFVVDKVTQGQVFLRVLCFLLSISFYHGSPHSYIWGMNNVPVDGHSSKT